MTTITTLLLPLLVPLESPIDGLKLLAGDLNAVLLAFITAIITWLLLKALVKNPGFAGFCGVVVIAALAHYFAKGGGLSDMATGIGDFVRTYVLNKGEK